MQTDPIGYGDGLNAHTYVRNDPINYRDPSGLIRTCFKFSVEVVQPPPGPDGIDRVVVVATVERCVVIWEPLNDQHNIPIIITDGFGEIQNDKMCKDTQGNGLPDIFGGAVVASPLPFVAFGAQLQMDRKGQVYLGGLAGAGGAGAGAFGDYFYPPAGIEIDAQSLDSFQSGITYTGSSVSPYGAGSTLSHNDFGTAAGLIHGTPGAFVGVNVAVKVADLLGCAGMS